MIVEKCRRKTKCSCFEECQSIADFCIIFQKRKINLCKTCIQEVMHNLSMCIVPKGVKSKFYIEKGAKNEKNQ